MKKNLAKEEKMIRKIEALAGRMAVIAKNAKPKDWGELFDLCETFETLEYGLSEAVQELRFLEQETDREENYD